MSGPNTSITKASGQLDFSAGVNSVKVTSQATQNNPNGMLPNELPWLINASVRDGGVSPRAGWHRIGMVEGGTQLYQGGFMYCPVDGSNPYKILSIGGRIIKVSIDPLTVTDLSAVFALSNPPNIQQAFFCQAEQFLIIQAGDGTTLPLFWDGTTLRRSIGITNTAVAPGTPGINEIPAAFSMDYYMGRLWYAQGRQYSAGDIVGGPSGTLAYDFRDAVLNVTENPLVLGGDGFTVPSNDGNIRALRHNANINTTLGQGLLFIFTRRAIYSLQVPVTRGDWIAADSNNAPLQTVVQLVNGSVNDRGIVAVNGDLFYQSLEPGIRSLIQAVRNFSQWSNTALSANENRVLQVVDRELMFACSGIAFDNRLLETTIPFETPVGVAHKALIPLDFIPISNFGSQAIPAWEGVYEGLNFLQLFEADFGGLDRSFALVYSSLGEIELWELTQRSRFDVNAFGESRVSWVIETPAFNWGNEFELKKLVSAELWVDRLWGTVQFSVDWRPDSDACWKHWHTWETCTARDCRDDVWNPCEDDGYPKDPFGDSYRATMTLPRPPEECALATGRPANIGYQHQVRIRIHGYCRIRGIILHAELMNRALYQGKVC